MSNEDLVNNILVNVEKLQNLIYEDKCQLLRKLDSVELERIMELSNAKRYKFLWFRLMIKERYDFVRKVTSSIYYCYEKYDFEKLETDTLNDLLLTLQSTISKVTIMNKRYKEILDEGTLCIEIIPNKKSLSSGSNAIIQENINWNLLLDQMYEQWKIN